jgi:hypothetical protein
MDVHKEDIVIAVLNSSGKLVMESMVETKAQQHSAVYSRSAGRAQKLPVVDYCGRF